MKTFAYFCFVLLLTGFALRAQTPTMNCNDGNWGNNNRSRACEVREMPAGAASKLTVDGGNNGGITVKGADRADVLVRAKVEAWGESDGAAKAVGAQVIVNVAGGSISANGPAQNGANGWSVSYEIFVPRRISLSLQAHNGGISISDVNGAMEFHTVNGGVSLKEVAGDVHGDTHNGGVSLKLSATRWEGTGLDVSTQNGGVSIKVPEQYSGQFEASTVNGGMAVALPNVVIPRGERSVNVTLGAGGPAIRVKTQNGGVSVSKV